MTKVAKKQFKSIDRVKTQSVIWVAQQFGCSTAYVYAVIRGEREQDEVKRAYESKYSEIKKVLAV